MTKLPAKILLLAGGGYLPRYATQLIIKNKIAIEVVVIRDYLFEGDIDFYKNLDIPVIYVEGLEQCIKKLLQLRIKDILILGKMKRPRNSKEFIDKFSGDNKDNGSQGITTKLVLSKLAKLINLSDGSAMDKAINVMGVFGYHIWGVSEILPEILASSGVLGDLKPGSNDKKDIDKGLEVTHKMGKLDVGQGCVVAEGRVLAVEASEGTNQMIKRCGRIRDNIRMVSDKSGVFVKCAKPQQDLRMDLPVVGIDTLKKVYKAKLNGIAVQANKVILVDESKMIKYANKKGLFIIGVSY